MFKQYQDVWFNPFPTAPKSNCFTSEIERYFNCQIVQFQWIQCSYTYWSKYCEQGTVIYCWIFATRLRQKWTFFLALLINLDMKAVILRGSRSKKCITIFMKICYWILLYSIQRCHYNGRRERKMVQGWVSLIQYGYWLLAAYSYSEIDECDIYARIHSITL